MSSALGPGPAERLLEALGIQTPEEIDVEAIAYLHGAIIVREGIVRSVPFGQPEIRTAPARVSSPFPAELLVA